MHACMHPPHSTSTLLSCLVLREEPTTRIIFQNVNGRIRLETRKWNFLFMTMHFFMYLFSIFILFHIDTFIHWIGIETKSSAHHDFRLILILFQQLFLSFISFKDFWKKKFPILTAQTLINYYALSALELVG